MGNQVKLKKVKIPVHKTIQIYNVSQKSLFEETVAENPDYFTIKNQYMSLIHPFREREADQFIGGMPVQLEKDNLSRLLQVNENNQLVYSITLKVDGERFLMFLGMDNVVYMIDRATNIFFFEMENGSRVTFPGEKKPLIIDGELINPSEDTFEFLIFDILFYKGTNLMNYDWNHRYIASQDAMNELKNCNLFCSLKKWFPITAILETDNIYTYIVKNTLIKGSKTKADGLILQPNNTKYVPFREWNKFANVQFKWKPWDELTVDLQIKQIKKNLWHLLTNTEQVFNVSQPKGKPVPATCIPTPTEQNTFSDGDIVEFKYYTKNKNPQGNLFTPYRLRNEKNANSYKTVLSTLKAIHDFFTLDQLKPALKQLVTPNGPKDQVLALMSKSNLVLCVARPFFSEKEANNIKNLYTTFVENVVQQPPSEFVAYELEFRIFLNGKKAVVIDKSVYYYLFDFLSNKIKSTFNFSIDISLNSREEKKYRSVYSDYQSVYAKKPIRNEYKQKITKYIFKTTDKKQQLYNNLTFKLELSREVVSNKVIGLRTQISENVVVNLLRVKSRHSFQFDPLWRIDLTRVVTGYNINDLQNETYELECEFIGDIIHTPFPQFLKSMENVYTFILRNSSY
jgi:hypothetical protein